MYIPKHLIETNLYTNGGEFVLSTTRISYRGYYWRDAQNNYSTGKNPNETPTIPLIPVPSDMDDDEHHEGITDIQATWFTNYNNPLLNEQPGRLPVKTIVNPTQEQLEFGEFQRYFVKKSNQNIYFEVNKEDHDLILNKDNNILWQLYVPISISWQLDDEVENAYKVNLATVQRVQLPGFEQFFKDKFIEFHVSRLGR